MSIAEFTPVMHKRINKRFKDKINLSKDAQAGGFLTAIEGQADSLRKELQKDVESYDGIYSGNLFQSIFGDSNVIDSFYAYIKNKIEDTEHKQTSYRDIEVTALYGSSDKAFKIKGMSYSHVKTYIADFIKEDNSLTSEQKATLTTNLKNFEIGHIVGLLSLRTANTFGTTFIRSGVQIPRGRGNTTSVTRVNIHSGKNLSVFMDRLVQLMLDLDIASSNSLEHNLGFYANSLKSITKSSVRASLELQGVVTNKASGNISKIIRNIIDVENKVNQASNKSYIKLSLAKGTKGFGTKLEQVLATQESIIREQIEKITDTGLKEVALNNLQEIVNLKSSDTVLESLEKLILSDLGGKPFLGNTTITGMVPVGSSKISVGTKNSISTEIKKLTVELKQLSQKLKKDIRVKQQQLRTTGGQFISPVSIKNLLNSRLAQQIQNNMGKGSAKAVLNYRTGRLAESAEVVNISNRDGAITAFYSYMKNPYATFAPGGAQSSPASRDPNKLIQLSIRQLATGIMANRLKVVPV